MKHKGLSIMLETFADTFANCVPLVVFLVAIIPTLESKIAIPFGMSTQIFGDAALSPYLACVIAFFGSLLPAILVMILARKLKSMSCGFVLDRFFNQLKARTEKHFQKFNSKTTVLKKCIYLCGFVALPLPLTGVYTGSLLAGLSNLKMWQGFLAVCLGEFITCIGMTLLCSLFENSAFYILMMTLILIGTVLLVNFLIFLVGKICKKGGRAKKTK